MKSLILTAMFLGIMSLAGFGVYWGMENFNSSDNFTNFVGSVELNRNFNLENKNIASEQDNFLTDAKKIFKKNSKKSTNDSKIPSKIAAKIIISTSSFGNLVPVLKTIATSTAVASSSVAAISSQIQNQVQFQNLEQVSTQIQPSQSQLAQPQQETNQILNSGRIIISEIMVGSDASVNYEFIELYNPNVNPINLTGWSIKKRSSSGSESMLVSASRFEGKIIYPNKYFLLARENGYSGNVAVDILWPKSSSYALAYTDNAIILYDAKNNKIEELGWQEIPKNKSYERISFDGNQFNLQSNPNPQNSQY